jgi:hypothetical protein
MRRRQRWFSGELAGKKMEREPRRGTVRGNKRASRGLILACGGGKGGHRSGRSTTSALPAACHWRKKTEEKIGWASIGLKLGCLSVQNKGERRKTIFLLHTIFSPPFTRTCKPSCCLKYLEIQNFLKRILKVTRYLLYKKKLHKFLFAFALKILRAFQSIDRFIQILMVFKFRSMQFC